MSFNAIKKTPPKKLLHTLRFRAVTSAGTRQRKSEKILSKSINKRERYFRVNTTTSLLSFRILRHPRGCRSRVIKNLYERGISRLAKEDRVRSILNVCEELCLLRNAEITFQIIFYEPKLSYKIFSGGTPRLSSILTTAPIIIGGPHIR